MKQEIIKIAKMTSLEKQKNAIEKLASEILTTVDVIWNMVDEEILNIELQNEYERKFLK